MLKDLKKHYKYLNPHKILTFILSLVELVISLGLMLYLQNMIDQINEGKSITFLETIVYLTVIILLLVGITFLFQYVFRLLESKGVNLLQIHFYEKLLNKDYDYFKNKTSGENLTNLIQIIPEIGNYLTTNTLVVSMQLITFVATFGFIVYLNVYLAIFVLITTVVMFLLSNELTKKIASFRTKISDEDAKINQHYLQSITGINIIRQLGKENYFISRFKEIINVFKYLLIKKRTKYYTLYISFYVFLTTVLPLSSLFLGIYFVSTGDMTIGSLMIFYAMVGNLQEPIRILAQVFSAKKEVKALLSKLSVVLDDKEDEESLLDDTPSFENFSINIPSYTFPNGKVVLENFSLKIDKGEKVCIKGDSGIGKSTLLKAIVKREVIPNGILYNDTDILKYRSDAIGKRILLVDQEPIIFERTLEENILLGSKHKKEWLDEIISVCQLNDFINEHGLNYDLKESGGNLSGGQKQRIALARMLIKSPDVLLLDEITSALDKNTSKKLVQELNSFIDKYNMTLIVVSHKNEFDEMSSSIVTIQ